MSDESINVLWKTISLGISFVILTMSSCTIVTNYQDNTALVEMVKAGADPQKASCSIYGETKGGTGSCAIMATK